MTAREIIGQIAANLDSGNSIRDDVRRLALLQPALEADREALLRDTVLQIEALNAIMLSQHRNELTAAMKEALTTPGAATATSESMMLHVLDYYGQPTKTKTPAENVQHAIFTCETLSEVLTARANHVPPMFFNFPQSMQIPEMLRNFDFPPQIYPQELTSHLHQLKATVSSQYAKLQSPRLLPDFLPDSAAGGNLTNSGKEQPTRSLAGDATDPKGGSSS